MEAFTVNRSGHQISVTFDARHFTEAAVTQLLNRLYIEYLSQRVNFGEDIEALGEEIKRDWWQQNKEQILAKIHAENSHC